MTTSLATTVLSDSTGSARIPRWALAYLRARHRGNVLNLILAQFERSALTKAQLARRLDIKPEQVTRLLGSPSNMTLDTLSDLLFALTGTEPNYSALVVGEMDRAAEIADVTRALRDATAAHDLAVRIGDIPGCIVSTGPISNTATIEGDATWKRPQSIPKISQESDRTDIRISIPISSPRILEHMT